MGEKLTGWEALTLWALLAEGGKSYWTPLLKKKMISKDHAADREALKRKGLIATEKRSGKGKGIWMEVTEAGWRRAGENLSVKLPTTQTSSAVFEAWLLQLERFLHAKDLPLAEFFGSTAASSGDNETALIGERPQWGSLDYEAMRRRIRDSYLAATGGQFNKGVPLSDLRERLADIDRVELDQVLGRMHLEEGTTLSGLNNPLEITPAIREAALSFKGEPMYVLWITK